MKILCLGNNTEDTNNKALTLAKYYKLPAYGLVNANSDITCDGLYHSSIYDIDFGELIAFAINNFNKVIVLNQTKDSYTHPDAYYLTTKAAQEINKNIKVDFLDTAMGQNLGYFEQLVKNNLSFCIFPFIELLVYNGSTTVCCRSTAPIVRLDQLDNFQTNKNYVALREKMLNGIQIPEHCESCYSLERKGILSSRQQETVEWANRLNLRSVDDLHKIKNPVYYEIRPNNICNLQCRTCSPSNSNLIFDEYKKLKIIPYHTPKIEYTDFDFVNFSDLKKLYVAGGEPTALKEFYNFLDKCIEENYTNFEFLINTNGVKFSSKFKEQANQFSNLGFIFSIDGFEKLNHYIRFPSVWKSIIDNARWVVKNNHTLTFNVTVSIYNIDSLYELFEFLEIEFPGKLIHAQLADSDNDILSAYNHPDKNLVVENLSKITKLKCYNNSYIFKSFVDGLLNWYSNRKSTPIEKLKEFYTFNDLLDESRNIKLEDYLPNLHKFRNEI